MAMIRLLVILLISLTIALAKKNYNGYEILDLDLKSNNELELIHDLEEHLLIDVQTELTILKPVSVMVSPSYKEKMTKVLNTARISFTIKNNNFQKQIEEEEMRLKQKTTFDLDDFNTLQQINDQLLVWESSCPSELSCEVYSIGTSLEGREINAIRIGKGNPVIFYDTLIHSREWLSGATGLKMINHVITNYGSDGDVNDLLDNYDFIFVPVVNPDGYEYSWTDDRMWRKNKAVNQGSRCLGVDLNRNFGVDEWGKQSSSSTCAQDYHGPSAASEPETRAIQNEALRLQSDSESGIAAWVSTHAYSYMWMFPFGYTEGFRPFSSCVRTDDYDDLFRVAEFIQEAIYESSGDMWDIGTTCEVIYATTGATIDYLRAKAGVKYVFTPEIRGTSFIVSPDEIQPSFEENWSAVVAMMVGIETVGLDFS